MTDFRARLLVGSENAILTLGRCVGTVIGKLRKKLRNLYQNLKNVKLNMSNDTDKACCDYACEFLCGRYALYAAGCLCGIGVLLTVILIPVSLNSVEYDEYAIRYDDLENIVHEDVYTEGKYVMTPQTVLFKFSNLVKKKEIDIVCLTANGIEVQLDVDVQYQLPHNQVYCANSYLK